MIAAAREFQPGKLAGTKFGAGCYGAMFGLSFAPPQEGFIVGIVGFQVVLDYTGTINTGTGEAGFSVTIIFTGIIIFGGVVILGVLTQTGVEGAAAFRPGHVKFVASGFQVGVAVHLVERFDKRGHLVGKGIDPRRHRLAPFMGRDAFRATNGGEG